MRVGVAAIIGRDTFFAPGLPPGLVDHAGLARERCVLTAAADGRARPGTNGGNAHVANAYPGRRLVTSLTRCITIYGRYDPDQD